MKVLKKIKIVLLTIVLVSLILIVSCGKQEIKEQQTTTTINLNNQRTNYVVIVNENSIFKDEAIRFANKKNAELLTYKNSIHETLDKLKVKKPIYTAIFATPEELTPDFVDDIDLFLRSIDDDPYLDTAYGIITSRDVLNLNKYINRLINYSQKRLNIYAVSPSFEYRDLKQYNGIDINYNCLTNCGSDDSCICSDEERATAKRIKDNLKNSNIFVISAHGDPISISLDNSEDILGSRNGLIIKEDTGNLSCYETNQQHICGPKYDTTKLELNNVDLMIAQSCTTGRINGRSLNQIDTRFGDVNPEGNISSSIVLSALQNGALNYVASSHVAISFIDPKETLIEGSFLKNMPIGIAIKDLKNRYILSTEKHKVSLPGSPSVDDPITKDFIIFHTRNWILFGDPSIVLGTSSYEGFNCIQTYKEKILDGVLEVESKIKFYDGERIITNSEYINEVELKEAGKKAATTGSGTCILKIPYTGKLKSVKVIPISGVNERYKEGQYPANVFYQDLGDEVLFQIPNYIAEKYDGEVLLKFQIFLV